jgi:predicted SprT family Zn-dependent metalloprotease
MRATVDYITKIFNEFNDLCFEGNLPLLPVEECNARSFMGVFNYKIRADQYGTEMPYEMKLRISIVYDMEEEIVKDTILHEMIHYYITYYRIKDTSSHGEVFLRIMNTINQKYNRHITVKLDKDKEVESTDQEKKAHFICVCELGQDMVFVQCARTRLLQIHQELANDTRISKMAWYYTENPFFNRFPNSSKVRLLKINRMELIDNLKGATELECDGRTLRQKRK